MKALIALVPLCLIMGVSNASAAEQFLGVWRNPKNSVHVEMRPCGTSLCGVVVWADDKAKADAAKGSEAPLIGSTLLRDFRQEKPDMWRGRVYVPDIGMTFSGTISIVDADHLKGRGCLLGRIACKSQMWTRVEK